MPPVKLFLQNRMELIGRVASVTEFSKGKAANITVAVPMDQSVTEFLQIKSFSPNVYSLLKKGMKIQVVGHVHMNVYEKDNKKNYTTELIADAILFLDDRKVSEAREAAALERELLSDNDIID